MATTISTDGAGGTGVGVVGEGVGVLDGARAGHGAGAVGVQGDLGHQVHVNLGIDPVQSFRGGRRALSGEVEAYGNGGGVGLQRDHGQVLEGVSEVDQTRVGDRRTIGDTVVVGIRIEEDAMHLIVVQNWLHQKQVVVRLVVGVKVFYAQAVGHRGSWVGGGSGNGGTGRAGVIRSVLQTIRSLTHLVGSRQTTVEVKAEPVGHGAYHIRGGVALGGITHAGGRDGESGGSGGSVGSGNLALQSEVEVAIRGQGAHGAADGRAEVVGHQGAGPASGCAAKAQGEAIGGVAAFVLKGVAEDDGGAAVDGGYGLLVVGAVHRVATHGVGASSATLGVLIRPHGHVVGGRHGVGGGVGGNGSVGRSIVVVHGGGVGVAGSRGRRSGHLGYKRKGVPGAHGEEGPRAADEHTHRNSAVTGEWQDSGGQGGPGGAVGAVDDLHSARTCAAGGHGAHYQAVRDGVGDEDAGSKTRHAHAPGGATAGVAAGDGVGDIAIGGHGTDRRSALEGRESGLGGGHSPSPVVVVYHVIGRITGSARLRSAHQVQVPVLAAVGACGEWWPSRSRRPAGPCPGLRW